MTEPNKHTIKQPREHLFSPHTDQCIYCGQTAEDDRIENTPCPRPPCTSCDGRGWLFCNAGNDESPIFEVQRCDACQEYEGDLAAFEAVINAAKAYPELLKFVQEVSELTHEGEPDEDGEKHDRPSEDFIATLNQLIMQARELLGTAEKCDECGETVPHVIGCPDGTEVCQSCFDAGDH